MSDPVAAGGNVFILEQLSRTPADSAQWEAQKETQRAQVTQIVQERRMAAWLDEIRADARIVDRRQEVLQPATEDEALPTSPFGR